MSWERRSESASMPTDSRTALTSAADGEVLPPTVRRRYAARCFILTVFSGVGVRNCDPQENSRRRTQARAARFPSIRALNLHGYKTGDSIDLTAVLGGD